MANIFGPTALIEDVHRNNLCIGCGACVELCPYFKNYKGKTAQLFSCDIEKGRCYAYCPKAEVDLNELSKRFSGAPYDGSPIGGYINVLASRAGEAMPRGNFQGGGTISALAAFALKSNVIDAVALTGREGLVPSSRLATDWREVNRYSSSKYMASPTLIAVNYGIREGYTRLGVVGTPCQITAVAQMRSNPLGKENFCDPVALTMGLFCNWALDTRSLMEKLSEKLDVNKIRRMDIPPPPSATMILETDDGQVEVPLSEVKALIPHTCFICPDMTSELADLSVGMYEGRPGWNTLIVRTEDGAHIVEKAQAEGFLETAVFPEENLMHLSKAAADKKERSLRTLDRRGLINTGEGRHAALRIPPEVVKRILGKF